MFGDNKSVVNSASIPHSKLHKRHNALSYHRTREAIAARFLQFFFIRSEKNCADILSKHWDYNSVWETLRPIMFWEGDTALIEAWDDWKKRDTEEKERLERKRLEVSERGKVNKSKGKVSPVSPTARS